MVNFNDTIAAIATAPGKGGVGIIRISGSQCQTIAQPILGGLPSPRLAELRNFTDADGQILDQGLALFFPSPHSFTGEDVLELHAHGGPVVLDMLLAQVTSLGARLARPGEFSERAYLNDKMDLAQAEAVADLIDSESQHAARAAIRSMTGVFSTSVHAIVDGLIQLRMYIEAAIDFPEEEIDFLADQTIHEKLATLRKQCQQLQANAKQGALLREGMTVVLAGKPNAGKSSLLNALAGKETAIVAHLPGTTRDILREHIVIDGMPLHIIDTAGLRESEDFVEQLGIARAWNEIKQADRLLLIVDSAAGFTQEEQKLLDQMPKNLATTLVFNKIDLVADVTSTHVSASHPQLHISAKTGQGIESLRLHLKQCMGFEGAQEGEFLARRRHLQALAQGLNHIEAAQTRLNLDHAGELAAEELRLAQQALSAITGEFSNEDLLGEIFSHFCIGK